ncbi:hypothetical protein KAR91_69225, partial [Candidatus Pacearchaeota archaeon]|nr:hypothetical protein [Candidatus Pacearchaeota archaeon]
MNNWNSKQLAHNKAEFHIGWVNYLDDADIWQPIDCGIVDTGNGFEVTKAPFSCSFPKYSTGIAEMYSTNRWDIWKKEKITAAPFGMSLEASDAVNVPGQIFDINGDGRLDAVIYLQAFPQWDADLIYYVHHGRAPRLQKLIRFNSALPSDITPEFKIEYSHEAEISSRIIPNGLTRAQHRANCHSRLNTPMPINADKGFYIR